MAKSIEQRIKSIERKCDVLHEIADTLMMQNALIVSLLNTIIQMEKTTQERLEAQTERLEKVLAEQTAVKAQNEELKAVAADLRAQLEARGQADEAIRQLLDRGDAAIAAIDDLVPDVVDNNDDGGSNDDGGDSNDTGGGDDATS